MAVEPQRILVIDDEHMVAKTLGRVLKGHEVTLTETVDHALTLVNERVFDIIFCDMMMPGLGGMDLYLAMARLHPEILNRLVLMTGGAYTSKAQAFMNSVPNHVVYKPFDIMEIRELVKQMTI